MTVAASCQASSNSWHLSDEPVGRAVRHCWRVPARRADAPRHLRPALGHPARAVAGGVADRPAAGDLPARRALGRARRRRRRQGDRAVVSRARPAAASGPRTRQCPVRAPGGDRGRESGAGRHGPADGSPHAAPGVLPSPPGTVVADAPPGDRRTAARRAVGPAPAPAPGRVLVGGLLAVEHTVST